MLAEQEWGRGDEDYQVVPQMTPTESINDHRTEPHVSGPTVCTASTETALKINVCNSIESSVTLYWIMYQNSTKIILLLGLILGVYTA